jgi:murein DD-endopeptidase MepM/ murein hydrolase activator NlpD/SH3-like domain-containing protein
MKCRTWNFLTGNVKTPRKKKRVMNKKKMRFTHLHTLPGLLVSLFLLAGCGGLKPLGEAFRKQSPHDKYTESLKKVQLEKTALGQDWLNAGQLALRDSLRITPPFRETGYFPADKATAVGYRLNARQGEKLTISLQTKARQATQVFVDVYERVKSTNQTGDRTWSRVAFADSTVQTLVYEIKKEGELLIRLQPELLRSVQYTVTIQRQPSLAFPVQGKGNKAVGSLYGVSRDAGRRRHEGIDIFAPKSTPVLAASDGYISQVNENQLGGKVVWQQDLKRGVTLYYAHLDSQLVRSGQVVKVGDTLGLVGNTGNARTTPPHLHFGIYSGQGAIDPYPFIRQETAVPSPVTADMTRLGTWVRIAPKKAVIRPSPDARALPLAELTQHTPLQVTAGAANWFRAVLPNGVTGYLSSHTVESLKKPLKSVRLDAEAELLDFPDFRAASVDRLESGASVFVLATFGLFQYVKTAKGQQGWMVK